MVIHEYGDSSLPKIVLLHPMTAEVREGYGHCMYLSEHYAKYGKLLERYMREEHKNV